MPKRIGMILMIGGVAIALGLIGGIVFYLSSDAEQSGLGSKTLSLAGDSNSIDALAAKPPFVSEIKAAGISDLGNVQVQIVRPSEIKQNEQAEFEVQLTRSNGYQFLEGAGYNFVVVQGNKIVYEAAGISVDGTEFIAPTFHNGAATIYVVVYPSGGLPQSDVPEDQKILNLKASKNAAVFDIDSVI